MRIRTERASGPANHSAPRSSHRSAEREILLLLLPSSRFSSSSWLLSLSSWLLSLARHSSIASQHLVPSHLVSIRVFDAEPAYQSVTLQRAVLPSQQALQIGLQILKFVQQSLLLPPANRVSNDNVCGRKPIINQIVHLSQRSVHRVLLNDPTYVLAFRQHKIYRIDLGAMNVGFHLCEGETDPLIMKIARPGSRLGDQFFLRNQICNGRHNGCRFKQWFPVNKCGRQFP